MRIRAVILASLAATISVAAESPLKKFGWFADFVDSCWVGDFPDGITRHRHCYTAQFGKFIRGAAILSGEHDGRMVDRFFGDSVFAWDDKQQRIVYYVWGSDGNLARHEAHYEAGALIFPVRSRNDPAAVAFRSVWRRLEDGSLEVIRERPGTNGWSRELTVKYRREAAAK